MKISLIDRSRYLRGMMLLIRTDRKDSAIALSSEDGISPERALEVQILDWE